MVIVSIVMEWSANTFGRLHVSAWISVYNFQKVICVLLFFSINRVTSVV